MKTLEEMRARLAEIVAGLKQFENVEKFEDDELEQLEALNEEFNALTKNIDAREKLEAMKNNASSSTGRKVSLEPVASAPVRVKVGESRSDKFHSFGEFLVAVKNHAHGKTDDKRLTNTLMERSGEDGGFLVPEEIGAAVTSALESDESLLAKTRSITVSGNNLSFPVDESAPWSNGISAYWTAEAEKMRESQGKMGFASLKLNKIACLVRVTDELLDDSTALESFIRTSAPAAILHKINSSIISGTGVGMPQGILNSSAKIVVPKEGTQGADTIVLANIIKMYSRLLPAARSKAAWYINAGAESQLYTLKDDLGNFMYLAPGTGVNPSGLGRIFNLPVIPMMGSLPGAGDSGDIVLADLSFYTTIVKSSGLKSSVSSHIYFDRDIQCYKFTMRVDGGMSIKNPVTTEFGGFSMSPVVVLADR